MASPDPIHDPLIALPAQPDGVAWPAPSALPTEAPPEQIAPVDPPPVAQLPSARSTEAWPTGPLDPEVERRLQPLLDHAFDDEGPLGLTQALVLVHRGRLVAERYQGWCTFFDRPPEPIDAMTTFHSWSMAKSMLHAVVGMLVAEGRLDLDQPAPVPEWAAPDDPRRAITLGHLLEMRDGLDFTEDYVDPGSSDVLTMLFGDGQEDTAHFAADRPLAASPGTRFNYSSGTSNVISGIVARCLGPGELYERFVRHRLFEPIGATTARIEMDQAGTWVASSSVHATALDYARFGLLVLRDGMWDGSRILPRHWVDHGRRARSIDADDGSLYGAHWWVVDDGRGTFRAAGFEGQTITICPALDLVLVRLGKTPAEHSPDLVSWRADVVDAFAASPS